MKFADFLSSANGGTVAEPDIVEPNVVEPEVDTPQEPVEEQATPSVAEQRVTLEDRMRAKGLVVPEDVDPVELYDQAIDRIASGTQAMQEAQQLRQELERLKSQPASQPPAAPSTPEPAVETPQQQAARMFLELQEYDPSLTRYVDRDENGQAVPKAAYGEIAVQAAKTINDYDAAERKQAQMLLRNPHLLIKDNMSEIERLAEEKARAIIEQRIGDWQREQQQAQSQLEQQEAQAREAAALQKFHEENKAKLFQIGSDGEPLRLPFDQDQYSHTPTGKYFMQRLHGLRSEMPSAPQLTLLNLALREATLAVPPVQKQPPAEVATPAQQRQRFVEQRNDEAALPHQSTPAASGGDATSGAQRLRFADMVRRSPEYQDASQGWQS